MLNAARSMQWQAKVLATVLIALGAATSATAAPITTTPQVFDFSLAQTNQVDPFAVQPYTATTLHSFNEFDAGLGTLQQVIFRWRSTLLASNTGEFDDETATINGTAEADLVGLGDLFSSPFSASASPPRKSDGQRFAGGRRQPCLLRPRRSRALHRNRYVRHSAHPVRVQHARQQLFHDARQLGPVDEPGPADGRVRLRPARDWPDPGTRSAPAGIGGSARVRIDGAPQAQDAALNLSGRDPRKARHGVPFSLLASEHSRSRPIRIDIGCREFRGSVQRPLTSSTREGPFSCRRPWPDTAP